MKATPAFILCLNSNVFGSVATSGIFLVTYRVLNDNRMEDKPGAGLGPRGSFSVGIKE